MTEQFIKQPLVSVIIPSYNHEKYILKAIQSVLDQTFQDFEIVITDDGSSDGSIDEIKKFTDPRIKLFCSEKNQGTYVTVNNCIKNSTGKYIAILNSDDVFLLDKLEKQVKFLEEHNEIGAVFGLAELIDEDGNIFKDKNYPYSKIFKQENRTKEEWLRYFFFNLNCLCHPSILVRRKCHDDVGLYDPRFIQVADFEFYLRLLLKYEIYILQENLIKFRIRANEANTSGQNPFALNRTIVETKYLLKNYLKIDNVELFNKIFPESKNFKWKLDKDLIPFTLANIILDSTFYLPIQYKLIYRNFAINILFEAIENEEMAKKIETNCNFRYIDFIKLTSQGDYRRFTYDKKVFDLFEKIINLFKIILPENSMRRKFIKKIINKGHK